MFVEMMIVTIPRSLTGCKIPFYVSYVGCSIVINQPKELSVLVVNWLVILIIIPDDGLKIEQHPMTAFSPSNFQREGKLTRSFAKNGCRLLNSKNENVMNLLCR